MIKNLKLGPNERMVSSDAAALFLSVPIGECIQHILTLLTQDTDLHKRMQLSPTNITDLIKVCLSTSFTMTATTPQRTVALLVSLIVLVSQIWMFYTMDSAIEHVRQRLLAIPHHIFIYIDDIWCIIKTPPTPDLRSGNQPLSNPEETSGNASMLFTLVYSSQYK